MPVTLEEPASLPPPPSLSYILYMYSLTSLTSPAAVSLSVSRSVISPPQTPARSATTAVCGGEESGEESGEAVGWGKCETRVDFSIV